MVRLYLLIGVVVVAFYVFSIVDCALYDHMRVKALPKTAWVLIVLIPVVGGLLWFAFGRAGKGANSGTRHPMAPDDDPEFLGSLGRDTAEMRERIRRLEEEFSAGDGAADAGHGDTTKPTAGGQHPTPPGERTGDAADGADDGTRAAERGGDAHGDGVRKNSKGRDSDPKPGHPDA